MNRLFSLLSSRAAPAWVWMALAIAFWAVGDDESVRFAIVMSTIYSTCSYLGRRIDDLALRVGAVRAADEINAGVARRGSFRCLDGREEWKP